MTIELVLLLMTLLISKHLIMDWYWQTDYELKTKGIYGHWGGIQHSGKHAIGTALCVLPFFGFYGMLISLVLDFVVHYHVDYLKGYFNKEANLNPSHPVFWWLIGLDQYIHHATYIFIISILI